MLVSKSMGYIYRLTGKVDPESFGVLSMETFKFTEVLRQKLQG